MSKNEETARENELRAYEQVLNGTCGLGYADCSLVDFARGLKCFIDAESQKPNGDTHLIAVLQRAACIGWELSRAGNRSLDRPDPDPRLEQAREALDRARTEIISIATIATLRIKELGGSVDPPSKTYGQPVAVIDKALAALKENL